MDGKKNPEMKQKDASKNAKPKWWEWRGAVNAKWKKSITTKNDWEQGYEMQRMELQMMNWKPLKMKWKEMMQNDEMG